MRALGRLVGTWELTGDATGTISYRWMAGERILIQECELELFGHRNTFIEAPKTTDPALISLPPRTTAVHGAAPYNGPPRPSPPP